jgi:putative ubiquitin-RnfH superfamily antitoxin RatB of RatAB toxin-antitoxin module
MQISVTYAEASKQQWVELDVADEITALEAIELSGMLERFPDIDLEVNKFGVFGKVVKSNHPLKPGDRVEIYRPITADPETVERRDQ